MRRLLPLALLLLCASIPLARSDDKSKKLALWPHWRGPSEQGYVTDKGVPLEWSEKKNVLWKTKLPGVGISTPIIWGDRAYLTASSNDGGDRYILCVRTSDGKLLWEQTVAKKVLQEKKHAWNTYASSSCATDGERVYAFFGTAGVFCYDVEGKFVWKKELGSFAEMGSWGTAASPYLYEDTVIINCDNDGNGKKGTAPASLVALDKKTGEQKWSTPRGQGRGFSTPRLMKTAEGRTDLVLNGAQALCGYDPKTGKELWRCGRSNPQGLHQFGEPMPVDDGKHIFVLSGRTGPYQLIKMPGKGDVTKTNVIYSADRGQRDVASPILHEGKVYCLDSRCHGITVFDMKTGKELETISVGRGKAQSMASPIRVGGKLLFLLDEGTTVVVEPGDKPAVERRNKLDGSSLDYGASPAVADGRLFIRSKTHLYCIGEKK